MRSVSQMQLSLAEVERTWWDALPETDKEHQARCPYPYPYPYPYP